MTKQSIRYTNSISPNWHLWVWRDACWWNCWNEFEMHPMISLWDGVICVWMGSAHRLRFGRGRSCVLRPCGGENSSLSVSPSGLWSLKERFAPLTASAFILNANPSPTASVTPVVTASDESRCASPHTKMVFEWEMRAVFTEIWRINVSLSVSIMPENHTDFTLSVQPEKIWSFF